MNENTGVDIFYSDADNKYDDLRVDVNKLYAEFPFNKKSVDYAGNLNNYRFIYRCFFLPLKLRKIVWHLFHRLNLDLAWYYDFKKYWGRVLGGRSFWSVYDLFFIKNIYRMKFQRNVVPDTDSSDVHLEAWQRPELLFQLLHLVCRSGYSNQIDLIRRVLNHKKLYKVNNVLEFGCGTAPIVSTFFDFFKRSEKIKYTIADIKTVAFHYAACHFSGNSNVKPELLGADNNFMPDSSSKYDIIFCMTVFEHLSDPLQIIKHFNEMLNENGLLVFDYILGDGDGLDTKRAASDRSIVLSYVNENFDVLYGDVDPGKSLSLAIAKRKNN